MINHQQLLTAEEKWKWRSKKGWKLTQITKNQRISLANIWWIHEWEHGGHMRSKWHRSVRRKVSALNRWNDYKLQTTSQDRQQLWRDAEIFVTGELSVCYFHFIFKYNILLSSSKYPTILLSKYPTIIQPYLVRITQRSCESVTVHVTVYFMLYICIFTLYSYMYIYIPDSD